MKIHSVSELAVRAAQDPALQAQIKADPVTAIANVAAPLQTDVWIYRMVVGALGLVVLIAIIGAIVLTFKGQTVPDVLTALGSAAVGALAGLLAPSPNSGSSIGVISMAQIEGYVTVYESSDGGSGDAAKTHWIFFVGGQALNTDNYQIAETMRLAVVTNNSVRVQYDPAGPTVSQARLEFDYVCETRRYAPCDKKSERKNEGGTAKA